MYRHHDRGVITRHLRHAARHQNIGRYLLTRALTHSVSRAAAAAAAFCPWPVKDDDPPIINGDANGRFPSNDESSTDKAARTLTNLQRAKELRLDFFSSNEKRFAALTNLPETFFRDVQSIRALANTVLTESTQKRVGAATTTPTFDNRVSQDVSDAATEAAADPATPAHESFTLTTREHDFLPYNELWIRRRITRKLDLSEHHPTLLRQTPAADIISSTVTDDIDGEDYEDIFRSRTGLRRVIKELMRAVYPFLISNDINRISENDLRSVLRIARRERGHVTHQDILDLFDCCYILHMRSDRAICKYVKIMEHRAASSKAPMPSFVLLQLLRADSSGFTAPSLKFLVDYLTDTVEHWVNDSSDSVMTLAVRLIRHARIVYPALLEDITAVTLRLMDVRFSAASHRNEQALKSLWCNTLMSLLAVPPSLNPFRSMIFQQRSQLSLLKYMESAQPNVPLDREGYRGMMRVQLAHSKTPQEREWAQTKVLSWPPWQEQHQMGGRSTNELEGKVSRVMKVINRMTEMGYDARQYDLAAQILAGWDTDKSPTIQTRASPVFLPLNNPWVPGPRPTKTDTAPIIWMARVLATRTLREAWMCFCDYTKLVPTETRSIDVYHAMFEKLHAGTESYNDDRSLPGDGREIFPDPSLPRDLVYIPTAVPTQMELFDKLRADGLQTTSRLLANLLRNAPSITQVRHYLTESHLSKTMVSALLGPTNHDETIQPDLVSSLPSHLLANIMYAFVRPYAKTTDKHTIEMQLRARDTARYIMRTHLIGDHRVWNLYLEAWNLHVSPSKKDVARLSTYQLWPLVYRALRTFQFRNVRTTFLTIRAVLPIAQAAALNYRVISSVTEHPLPLIKQLFLRAAYGHDFRAPAKISWHEVLRTTKVGTLHSLPLGDDIEAMVWLLMNPSNETYMEDVLALLHWIDQHQEHIFADTRRISKHNMCAFRIILEGLWADDELWEMGVVKELSRDQFKRFHLIRRNQVWPSNDTVLWYMENTGKEAFFKQLRNAWKHVHRKDASGVQTTPSKAIVTAQRKPEAQVKSLKSLSIRR